MNKIRRIIASMLMLAILIPNIQVQAIENEDLIISDEVTNEVIKDNDDKSEDVIIEDEITNGIENETNNENIESTDNNELEYSKEVEKENSNNDTNFYLEEDKQDSSLGEDIIVRNSINYMLVFKQSVNGKYHEGHDDSCYIIDSSGNKKLRPTHPSVNANVYEYSTLNSIYTYVNQGYVNDAPVIEAYTGKARVLVNGYTGWINGAYTEVYKDETGKETIYNWSDYELVPVASATNPSYYISENGILYHYISSDLTAKQGTSGFKIMVGSAPSFMKNGVKYLSYDANYFYDGSNIENGLNNLINDLKAGNKNNSINKDNPFYNYYQYLSFRSKTVYTASELDKFINAKTDSDSKLRGLGQAFKDAEEKYGVNAILALGVAINESNWGKSDIAQNKNNLFGIKATDNNVGNADVFNTPADSIVEFAKNYISAGYCNIDNFRYYGGHLGNKNLGANVKYASDPFWAEKAARYAFTIDLYLSGNDVNSLIDTNSYQIGMYTSSNKVVNSKGSTLYNVNKIGTTFVLNSKDVVNVNGTASYEIYPEKTTVTGTLFKGEYDWSIKGYISTNGIKLINTQKNVQPPLTVIGGATRFETAVELSKSKFDTSDYVVLINKNSIFDGISATPLATVVKAPILYTEAKYIQESTKEEIKRLSPKNVIIIGGEGVVTGSVVNELKSIGVNNVVRLGGATRYDTALEVAKYIDANCYGISEIFMVNGVADADAMSVAAVGGKNNMPILLTETNKIPINTYNWLKSKNLLNAYVIGGTGVVSNNVLETLNSITRLNISNNRVGGATRQDTNALIVDRFYGENLEVVYAARSHILFDALAVGPIAALDNAPVVLINTEINTSQKSVLERKTAKKIVQTGLDFPQQAINSLRRVLRIYNL